MLMTLLYFLLNSCISLIISFTVCCQPKVHNLVDNIHGYQSATEMAGITYDASEYGLGTLRIEQDKDFKPCTLGEIEDEELQAFLSRLNDKD